MLYFAYGSNMDFAEMQNTCPSAKFVAVAKFPDYRLEFTRRSRRRECGVSDVVASPRDAVWGVVYEIAEIDLPRLDGKEGFRAGRPTHENSYNREQFAVWRDGKENQPLFVWIYKGNLEPNPPLPNAGYKSLLVNGASHWKLPADYIEQLKRIVTL